MLESRVAPQKLPGPAAPRQMKTIVVGAFVALVGPANGLMGQLKIHLCRKPGDQASCEPAPPAPTPPVRRDRRCGGRNRGCFPQSLENGTHLVPSRLCRNRGRRTRSDATSMPGAIESMLGPVPFRARAFMPFFWQAGEKSLASVGHFWSACHNPRGHRLVE